MATTGQILDSLSPPWLHECISGHISHSLVVSLGLFCCTASMHCSQSCITLLSMQSKCSVLFMSATLFMCDRSHVVTAAMLLAGTTVKVSTVDGKVDLKVPSGTQPGTTLVMSKRGVPRLGVANSRGDHQVRILLSSKIYPAVLKPPFEPLSHGVDYRCRSSVLLCSVSPWNCWSLCACHFCIARQYAHCR